MVPIRARLEQRHQSPADFRSDEGRPTGCVTHNQSVSLIHKTLHTHPQPSDASHNQLEQLLMSLASPVYGWYKYGDNY